ncbi:MAG: antibiotic biosynthesis monooxygenase [Myxococcales bacterium]|nr:antibiotic biosynthesis monooxygenase [Myxococcales bacterium]
MPIVAAPSDGPFGRQLTFRDPAGYAVVAHDRGDAPRSAIRTDRPVVTLVNVFDVAPERQGELLALLERATEETMRHLPGFVSANLHRSLDGKRVVNYAQWRSREDFEAMLADPGAQVHMREASAMADAAPSLYEVSSVH